MVKAMKLVLVMSVGDVAVRLLPWLLVTSQHELPLTQLLVDSPLVHSEPLFCCIDGGVCHHVSYAYLSVICVLIALLYTFTYIWWHP